MIEQEIKIIIADDHSLFIQGLSALLQTQPTIEIAGIANTGKELLQIMQSTKADIILMDINMPEMNGLDACHYLKMSHQMVKVIVLSTYSEQHMVEKAKQNGASAYLLKTCTKDELIQTIMTVHEGKKVFPAIEENPKTSINDSEFFIKQFDLTKREMQILNLIKKGCTSQKISEELFLSVYTVETHRKNINKKLGLHTPGALMKFLVENNF